MHKVLLIIILFVTLNQNLSAEWQWVYLASFPRSGNTWTRNLFEEATNLTTASECEENNHRLSPFGFLYSIGKPLPPDGTPFLLKTHEPHYIKIFDKHIDSTYKAIRLIRHPIDSFYSYYKFLFIDSAEEFPTELLYRFILTWKNFHEFWDERDNVLTISYEDLLNDPYSNLKLMLSFSGFKVEDKDIERALQKYPPEGKPLKHAEHFSKTQLKIINKALGPLMEKYHYKKI